LPKGKVQLKVDFACNGGGGFGKGATVTMGVNDTKVADGQLPKTIPIQISPVEGLHIGTDVGSAVDFAYKLPFQFIGRIEKVTVY
jgi:arylsulfatase